MYDPPKFSDDDNDPPISPLRNTPTRSVSEISEYLPTPEKSICTPVPMDNNLPAIEDSLAEVFGPKNNEDEVEESGTKKKSSKKKDKNFKPQKGQRWPLQLEEQLCQYWEEEPQLYTNTETSYKYHGPERKDAIQRIADKMGLSFEVVDTHMYSIRTTYGKALNKPSGSGANQPSIKRCKEVLKMCHFLQDYMKANEGLSNLEKLETEVADQALEDTCNKETIEILDTPPRTKTRGRRKTLSDTMKKKQSPPDDLTWMSKLTSCVESVAEAAKEERKTSHLLPLLHDGWAQATARKLRSLPLLKAERLKLKIDDLVLETMEACGVTEI